MYKGVLFDLDGTLLDTIGDLANAFNFALEKRQLPLHDKEAYKRFVGEGKYVTFQRALGSAKDDYDIEEIASEFDWYLMDHLFETTDKYPGIQDLLNWLKENNVKIAVVTNKDHEYAIKTLNHYFAEDTFDYIIGASKEWPSKPNPYMIVKATEMLGLDIQECLFVGDTKADIVAAQAAFMDCCGVTWGFRNRQELEEYKADYIVDNTEELKEVISKGNL